jgi:hypothetical protein
MRVALGVTAVLTLLVSGAVAAPPSDLKLAPGASEAAKVITRGALEAPIRFLSHDLLEGRAP